MKIFKNKHFNIQNSNFIIPVVTGIISCLIYETIFPYCSNFIFIRVKNIISLITKSFNDSIYAQIPMGYHSAMNYMIFLLVSLNIFMLMFKDYLHIKNEFDCFSDEINKKDESLSEEDINHNHELSINTHLKNLKKDKKIFIFSFCMFFISFLASMYSYGKESYINTISKTTLNNIEIVSPYISDYDYKLLKSRFYSIQSFYDFNSLTNDIERIAKKNGLKI